MGEHPSSQDHPHRAQVRVDLGRREPLRRIWRYVGYDEPNYTYTANGRELLGKLGGLSDAPYYIRCHFLLCSGDGTGRPKWGSTNVYTEDARGEPVYEWEIIDHILDAIVQAGCVPFVELGFTPQAMTTAGPEVTYDDAREGGWRYPPRDYGRWMELIRTLGEHCLWRYGTRQVDRWYWELWNEPDIHYWQGTMAQYCRLYDYTVAGLTVAIPQARVGGPGTTSPSRPNAGGFLRDFLDHCTHGTNAITGKRGTRLDFVSFHTKGGRARQDPHAAKETPTIRTLVYHVAAGLGILDAFPELAGRELILTECDPDGWAAGGKYDNPNLAYRNTEYYASYLANAACKLMDLAPGRGYRVDGMLTWAFQFEDREYFEGLRTLSTNGIDKPVLNALRLLSRLGSARCAVACDASRDPLASEAGDAPGDPPDVSGLAAMDARGTAQVLLVSHHDDWDVSAPTTVKITLSGLEPGRSYDIRSYAVDELRGNAHTAWRQMGEPQQPTAEQRGTMVRASRLLPQRIGQTTADEGGRIEVETMLPAHCVVLLEFAPTGEGTE